MLNEAHIKIYPDVYDSYKVIIPIPDYINGIDEEEEYINEWIGENLKNVQDWDYY